MSYFLILSNIISFNVAYPQVAMLRKMLTIPPSLKYIEV